jgi:hypothetical protein
MSMLKRFVVESTPCVCGHVYGDHLAKAPHRCTEDHAVKAGHRCSCMEFQAPIGTFPDSVSLAQDRDPALAGAADHEFQRVLGSIPRSAEGGFGSFN